MDIVEDIIRQCVLIQMLVLVSLPLEAKPESLSDDHSYLLFFEGRDSSTTARQNPSSLQSDSTLDSCRIGWHSSHATPPVQDSTGTQKHLTGEPQEMTSEVFNRLNNLPFPKPSGLFAMDGYLDTSATLLVSHDGVLLYAAIRGSQLYVATTPSKSQHADMFVFIAFTQGELWNAPFGKKGRVAAWSAFLSDRYGDTSASWYDASSSILNNIADEKVGAVTEGVIDFELLAGTTPSAIYLAVGKYQRAKDGRLIAKLPVGRHDGNIAAGEFYKLAVPHVSRNK